MQLIAELPIRMARESPPWAQFLKAQWDVFAAADFFTVEVWGLRGLVTFYVILDRDSKYPSAFRDMLEHSGVKVVRRPNPVLSTYRWDAPFLPPIRCIAISPVTSQSRPMVGRKSGLYGDGRDSRELADRPNF